MNHLQFRVSAGTLAVTWNSDGRFTRVDWYDSAAPAGDSPGWSAIGRTEIPAALGDVMQRLRSYFITGEPIGPLPWELLDFRGCSEFQIAVYRAICLIPHGETRTYAWVARRIGKFSPRAVGQALKRNPFPIIVPCHRVVGTGDALGGFMGSTDPDQPELRLKKWLLELENCYLNPPFSFLTPQLQFSTA
jgi:methylated-DNA-[protein]-cysteine S-methyltransferase